MNKLIVDVPFFQVPNSIYDSAELDIYEKVIYIFLCRCGNNSKAFPSYNTIAKKCGMSRRKAIDAVESLVKKNFLIKKIRPNASTGANYSNIYELIFK